MKDWRAISARRSRVQGFTTGPDGVAGVSDLGFAQLTNENDPATCRGRATHARLAAEESADQDFKRIFQRLAELYEAKASKLEAVETESKLDQSDEAGEAAPPHQES